MTKIIMIAALGKDHSIGKEGDIPWKLSKDLQFFKEHTLHKTVLMGRKTAISLRRALPNRRNLVLTQQNEPPYQGMEVIHSIQEAIEKSDNNELVIIGGEKMYEAFLPQAQELILTFVDTETQNADAFFPQVEWSDWELIWTQAHPSENGQPAYEFRKYIRK